MSTKNKATLPTTTTTLERKMDPARVAATPETHDENKKPAETDLLAQLRISRYFSTVPIRRPMAPFALGELTKRLALWLARIPRMRPVRNAAFVRRYPTMAPALVIHLVDVAHRRSPRWRGQVGNRCGHHQ